MSADFAIARRRFIAGAGPLAGSALLPAALAPSAARAELGRARTISIFHTTDLHGRILPTSTYEGLDDVGGFARCASCIRQWRRESPHSLTVDVGDVVQGTAVSLHRGGRLMVELFNRLGYDAWSLGNHDFDWGPEKMEGLLETSQSPVLTANVSRDGAASGSIGGAWSKVKPWIVREVAGFRIGLIGLITPGLASWLSPETLGGVAATEPAAALRQSLAEIKGERCDAVVVLGHMGWRFNDDYANPVRALLRDAREVDVYLAGHSHQDQPSWTQSGVVCSQASYHGIHCGRVDLTFDLDRRKLVSRRAFTVLMDDRFPLDPLVMELARPDLDAAEAQLAREVATLKRPLKGRGRGSELVTLLCESFAASLKKQGIAVDGVFHGTFGSGDLQPRRLTVADCWKIIPYENLLVTAQVTGADLLKILAEDAALDDSDRTLWPFEVARDERGEPRRILLRGDEVPRDKPFTIAFNSYDAQSGGRRFPALRDILSAQAARRRTTALDTRTALIDALLDRGEIG